MIAEAATRPRRRYRDDGRPAAPLNEIQAQYRSAVLRRIADGTYAWESVDVCLCGASDAVTLSEKDRFGFPVRAVACRGCGLVRSTPRLSPESLPAFYEQDYHGLHMGIVDPEPTSSLVRAGQGSLIYGYVAPHLSEGCLRVAEVGAGNGGVLREFAAAAAARGRSTEVFGCEYSGAFVRVATSMGTRVLQGGIDVLLDEPAPDALILSHVVEHLPDPRVELSALRSWLRPDSLVYVEVPGLLSLHTKPQYDFDLLRYLTLAHTFHFTLASLEAVMIRAGFHLIDGDEEIRGVFAIASVPGRPSLPPVSAGELTSYLRRVERSPRLMTRRARARGWRILRPRLRRLAVGALGERGMRAVVDGFRGMRL